MKIPVFKRSALSAATLSAVVMLLGVGGGG